MRWCMATNCGSSQASQAGTRLQCWGCNSARSKAHLGTAFHCSRMVRMLVRRSEGRLVGKSQDAEMALVAVLTCEGGGADRVRGEGGS